MAIAGRPAAADLSPSYFALVMATGIVSVGAHLLDVDAVAVALFAFNIAAYVVLWTLTIVRIARHRPALLHDLTDHWAPSTSSRSSPVPACSAPRRS